MSTLNSNPIAKAVRTALLAGTAAALAMPAAYAAEDEEGEKVIITGSRIKQTDIEGPTPVTVIDRAQIEQSGFETVADVLRTTTFNSFGSFRERSGSSGGQAATINLRGLGSSRTAVLVNGKRLPGTPLFGTSAANLNALPLSAVERVEVLTDGASAIYGADAIAGVVNIILRKDYEGLEMEYGVARPEAEGGDEESGSLAVGHAGDKGNIVFSAEFFRRDAVFDGDRPFSAAQVLQPGGDFGSATRGISVGGNTGFNLAFSEAFAVGDCTTVENGGLYAGVFTNPFGVSGDGCGFAYADISKMTGDVNRVNSFLSANYQIAPDHNFYLQNSLTRVESEGRYAPAVGFFQVDGGVDLNANGEFTPNGEDFLLFHRFVGHGPRDDSFVDFEMDFVVGMEGVVGQTIDYDVYYRFFDTEIKNLGQGYVGTSLIEAAVANNEYNFVNPLDPANAAAITATTTTLTRDLSTQYEEAGVSFSGFGFDLPGGEAGWAVGVDWATEDYFDTYDAAREAGNVIGSAGNSSFGFRERWAAFGEMSLPVLDTVEVRVAGRFDSYETFGEEFSPQIAVLYRPMDNLLFRASAGEGFKAPNLTSLFSARAQSFNNVTDILQCQSRDVDGDGDIGDADDLTACPTFQVENFSGGNPGLEAEEADTFNVGVVYEPIENLNLKLDVYKTEINNAITQISLQNLLDLEIEGASLPPGTYIQRGAPTTGSQGQSVPGRILEIGTGFANVATLEVDGWDLNVNYSMDTNVGRFSFDLTHSNIDTYDFTSLPGEDPVNQVGTRGAPDSRTSFQGVWSMNEHTVALNTYMIAETDGSTDSFKVPSFTNHNLTYIYNTSWDADITFGIRNVTDEQPSIDQAEGWTGNFEPQLYDVYGRTPYISYKQRF